MEVKWALIHHDWHPCKKRILGYRHSEGWSFVRHGSHGDLSPPAPVASGGTQSSHCCRPSPPCKGLGSF